MNRIALILILIVVGCQSQSPDEARRDRVAAERRRLDEANANRPEDPILGPHQSEDLAYERNHTPEELAHDRAWQDVFRSYYFDQHFAYEKALAKADSVVGSPTHAWPPGYFDRH
jgi:hypothetical protein